MSQMVIVIYALARFSNLISLDIVEGVNLDLAGYYRSNFWLLFLTQFLTLGFVNVLATTVALRRYLKV